MTVALTLAMIMASAIGIAHLMMVDPKRIRAHRLEAPKAKRHPFAWTLIWLPGPVLLIFDQWSAALMWLGGMPIIGWIIVSTPPKTYAALQEKLRRYGTSANQSFDGTRHHLRRLLHRRFLMKHQDASVLRARIDQLEARLEQLEQSVHERQLAKSKPTEVLLPSPQKTERHPAIKSEATKTP